MLQTSFLGPNPLGLKTFDQPHRVQGSSSTLSSQGSSSNLTSQGSSSTLSTAAASTESLTDLYRDSQQTPQKNMSLFQHTFVDLQSLRHAERHDRVEWGPTKTGGTVASNKSKSTVPTVQVSDSNMTFSNKKKRFNNHISVIDTKHGKIEFVSAVSQLMFKMGLDKSSPFVSIHEYVVPGHSVSHGVIYDMKKNDGKLVAVDESGILFSVETVEDCSDIRFKMKKLGEQSDCTAFEVFGDQVWFSKKDGHIFIREKEVLNSGFEIKHQRSFIDAPHAKVPLHPLDDVNKNKRINIMRCLGNTLMVSGHDDGSIYVYSNEVYLCNSLELNKEEQILAGSILPESSDDYHMVLVGDSRLNIGENHSSSIYFVNISRKTGSAAVAKKIDSSDHGTPKCTYEMDGYAIVGFENKEQGSIFLQQLDDEDGFFVPLCAPVHALREIERDGENYLIIVHPDINSIQEISFSQLKQEYKKHQCIEQFHSFVQSASSADWIVAAGVLTDPGYPIVPVEDRVLPEGVQDSDFILKKNNRTAQLFKDIMATCPELLEEFSIAEKSANLDDVALNERKSLTIASDQSIRMFLVNLNKQISADFEKSGVLQRMGYGKAGYLENPSVAGEQSRFKAPRGFNEAARKHLQDKDIPRFDPEQSFSSTEGVLLFDPTSEKNTFIDLFCLDIWSYRTYLKELSREALHKKLNTQLCIMTNFSEYGDDSIRVGMKRRLGQVDPRLYAVYKSPPPQRCQKYIVMSDARNINSRTTNYTNVFYPVDYVKRGGSELNEFYGVSAKYEKNDCEFELMKLFFMNRFREFSALTEQQKGANHKGVYPDLSQLRRWMTIEDKQVFVDQVKNQFSQCDLFSNSQEFVNELKRLS